MPSIYLLVEGERTEKQIYEAWIKYIHPSFDLLRKVEDSKDKDGYFIIAGFGQPSIFTRIENALTDIKSYPYFDRLVIALDAEESSVEDVEKTVKESLNQYDPPGIRVEIVVANCCMETWLLGNNKLIRRNPTDPTLLSYIKNYNIATNDPEHLANLDPNKCRTKAQFHHKYLKLAFKERSLNYSKSDPKYVCQIDYFNALRDRTKITQLKSFRRMLDALS